MDTDKGDAVTARTGQVLTAVLAGDVAAMVELYQFNHEQITAAARHVDLVLQPAAVARVLKEFDAGAHSPDDVQRWASFMRAGFFVAIPPGGIFAIDIEYEPDAEDAIVETLARLDELGDIIDGELRHGEAAELRDALLAASATRPG
jgi:hypothetical protein